MGARRLLLAMVPTLLGAQVPPGVQRPAGGAQGQIVERPGELTLGRVFHIAGVPGVKRNMWGELAFTQRSIIFFKKGTQQALEIPYQRVQRVQRLTRDRQSVKAGAAVWLLTPVGLGAPLGTYLMMRKQKVDAIVFQYLTENGGLAGAVFHISTDGGARSRDWLERFGIAVEEVVTPARSPVNK